MIKKIFLCFTFFFAFSFSCVEKQKLNNSGSECNQIKDILTDCMSLHRGAFDYVKNCGSLKLEEISSIETCEEIIIYIENKD